MNLKTDRKNACPADMTFCNSVAGWKRKYDTRQLENKKLILTPEGSQRLFELCKQFPERRIGQDGPRSPLEQLRHLLIRFS